MSEQEPAPDLYANGVQVSVTPYDVLLELQLLGRPGQDSPEVPLTRLASVRMSHVHAKVMAMILRRALKEYEMQTGTVVVHPEVLPPLGLDAEKDW
jgi:hypothetical protein